MHPTLTAHLAASYHPWVQWREAPYPSTNDAAVSHVGGGTGDGWYHLQERLFRWWARRGERWTLAQVKEKFAELTVYANPVDGSQEGDRRPLLYVAHASQRICEHCGGRGGLAVAGGWYATVCERHRAMTIQEQDAAERAACDSAAAVLDVMAAQQIRGPAPGMEPDLAWAPASIAADVDRSLRMFHLDLAITWLLERAPTRLQPADVAAVLPAAVADSLHLLWTDAGLSRDDIVTRCHTALVTADATDRARGTPGRLALVHLPNVFVLPT